jgi:hypothetical protein
MPELDQSSERAYLLWLSRNTAKKMFNEKIGAMAKSWQSRDRTMQIAISLCDFSTAMAPARCGSQVGKGATYTTHSAIALQCR